MSDLRETIPNLLPIALDSDAAETAAVTALNGMEGEDWDEMEEEDRDEVRAFTRTAIATYLTQVEATEVE